jgi:hypothetical protein
VLSGLGALASEVCLNANELAHALVARGHLTEEAVVRGDFLVREVSRRHSNFIVSRQRGDSLFVKHAADDRGEAAQTLQREARFYWLDGQGHLPQLRGLLPRFRDYDPTARTLVLDWIAGSETLADVLRRGELSADAASALGRALATLQAAAPTASAVYSVFPAKKPWILSLYRADLERLHPISNGQRELLRQVGQLPVLSGVLDRVLESWRCQTLVHGDLKLDNCLLEASSQGGPPAVRLVDWELVDMGDPAWDVATVIQGWLSHGVLSGLLSGSLEPVGQAGRDYWASARRAASSFFGAYVAGCSRLDYAQLPVELGYVQAHLVARLVVTAYEALHQAPVFTPSVVQLLTAAQRLSAMPDQLSRLLAMEVRWT